MDRGSSKRKPQCRLLFSIAILAVASLSSPLLTAQTGSGGSKHAAKPAAQRQVQVQAVGKAATAPSAKYYALVIGNNNYQYVPKLQTAVKDATDIANLLQTRYGFITKPLFNATRDEILTALAVYRKSLTQNSNLLIYYAGHGYLDQEADEAYWFPVDAERDNPANWISTDDITRSVRTIPSLHVLVISDSCYSGAILRDVGNDSRAPGAETSAEVRAAYLARKQASKSRDWMASGSIEPVSDGGPAGHSIFASAVIDALSRTREDQFAASDLFYSYIQRRVGGNSQQLPQYGSIRNSGDGLGDFIFSKGGSAIATDIAPPVIDIPIKQPDVVINNAANNGARFDAAGDRDAINAVLHQYEEGRKRKDASALWKIWPNAPIETKQRFESYFKDAKSIQTKLEMDPPQVAGDHMNATVSGHIHEGYTPKNGSTPPASDQDITFLLKKNNGVWTIADVK
jgi:uncharacterized caspase-like protein